MTLLLITHEPRLAARCDEQLRMADGRLHGPLAAGPRLAPVSGGGVA
jgi:ABC-type lipoprotein export system ATPase subunit